MQDDVPDTDGGKEAERCKVVNDALGFRESRMQHMRRKTLGHSAHMLWYALVSHSRRVESPLLHESLSTGFLVLATLCKARQLDTRLRDVCL